MKKFRNWVTFAVVLAMVLSLTIGVSATSSSKSTLYYGTLSGWCAQSTSNINLVNTTTSVTRNVDHAYLAVTADFSNGDKITTSDFRKSSTGALSYNPSFPIYITIDSTPVYVFVAHEVRGGTDGHDGFVCHTQAPISI